MLSRTNAIWSSVRKTRHLRLRTSAIVLLVDHVDDFVGAGVDDADLVIHHDITVIAVVREERDDAGRDGKQANVTGNAMADAMRKLRLGHPGPLVIKALPQLLTLVRPEALTSKTHLVSPLGNPTTVLWPIRCLPLARLLCFATLALLGLPSFASYTFALSGARPLSISLVGIASLL